MDVIPSTHPPKTLKEKPKSTVTNQPKGDSTHSSAKINKIVFESDLSREGSDVTWKMNISICKDRVKVLVDSGAHASMIKSCHIQKGILYYPEVKYGLIGISGPSSSVQTLGAAYANINQCGVKMKHQFQIAGKNVYLNYDGILGSDFMNVYKSKIDFENLKIRNVLPPWHNLYEMAERQEFEKKNPHLSKEIIENVLIYRDKVVNESPKNEAKCGNSGQKGKIDKILEARISSFETISASKQPEITILPRSMRNFKIDAKETSLCKEKLFANGVYMKDTIVDAEHNVVSIVNDSDEMVTLNDLSVEKAPIEIYDIYRINGWENCKKQHRVREILSRLDLSHCTPAELQIVEELVKEYHDVFYLEGDGLTFAKCGEHKIFTTPGINPVNTRQYRIPLWQRDIINNKIDDLLEKGIIEPSKSLWNSPLLLVPKKSETDEKEYRLVVDYKNVNKHTETQTYPMPNLEEELCKMHGAKYFSTMDIQSAFHQLKLNENDREKTAFTSNNRKFQFRSMPFGLKGSPITWQSYITDILIDFISRNAMVYMDDIMAYDKTLENHRRTLFGILDRLRENNLKLNISKTKFFASKIKYLGHTIDRDGCRPSDRNVEAVKNFPMPKNEKEVQRFIGMASYFRKFINSFAKKAQPLYNLSKKNVKFEWTDECNKAFEELKVALTTAPVLVFPDFSRQFYISVDASNYAVGGYISNEPPPNDKPIEYFSKSLNSAQRNYSTTHKELLAIILAIEQFQHFVWGKRFVLYTDHQALTYLFNQCKPGSRLLRWKLTLAEYDFVIMHRKGSNNVVSDCLSRIEAPKCADIASYIKNPTTKAIMQVTTRSRAKESEIIGDQKPRAPIYQINEEPSISLDNKKYEKIVFLIDGLGSLAFKKLQAAIKRKIDLKSLKSYAPYSMDENLDLILLPKINFETEKLETAFIQIREKCVKHAMNHIAINCGITNYQVYWQIKQLIRQVFGKTEISLTLFLGTQIEINDINEINEILRSYHSSILGGHRGFDRMKSTVRKFYTWPTMNTDIRKFIENCAVCEKSKIHRHTHTPLQITSVAKTPFEKIYIDFVGEISPNSSDGHKYIMSISCDLTKYVIMTPTFDSTALTAAKTIVEEVCLVFNFPKIIVSDNGPAFVSEIFKQMAKLLDIKHIKTTPYHPQSNGGIERYHRTLGQYIRAYTQKNPMTWHKYLPYFTFSYNSSVHSTTGFAPHTLVFGFDLEIPISVKKSRPNYNYDSYHNELLTQLKEAHARVRELIQKRKNDNKIKYDNKNCSELKLKRNDLVLILNDVKRNKFDNKYSGPYRVEEIISPAATKIRKNQKSIIVHNDKLKISKAKHGNDTPPLLVDKN